MALLAASACSEETEGPKPLTSTVGLQDVSILYPLPSPIGKRTSLIGAAEHGALGALLPHETFEALPPLHTTVSNGANYDFLRVVGIRIDPCFPGLDVPSEAECKNQIRLIMQPVVISNETQRLTTLDLAIHLFYSLDRQELTTVLADVVALREASLVERDSGPLGVHPALASEGVEGPFAVGLRDILLAHAGEQNLTRVTFMGVEQVGQRWFFGGYDIDNGELIPIDIPLIHAEEEKFSNQDLEGKSFENAFIFPPSPAEDDLTLFFDPTQAEAADEPSRLAAYDAALRIENPENNSPDTIDCATCHIANAARRAAERAFAFSAEGRPDAYRGPDGALPEGATIEATNHLRAFGYQDDKPGISQRVVNETTAVVDHVNRFVVTSP